MPSLAEAITAWNSRPTQGSELREALEPFAAVADEYDDREDDSFEVWKDAGPVRSIRATFKLGMYRKARAALAATPSDQPLREALEAENAELQKAAEELADSELDLKCVMDAAGKALRSAKDILVNWHNSMPIVRRVALVQVKHALQLIDDQALSSTNSPVPDGEGKKAPKPMGEEGSVLVDGFDVDASIAPLVRHLRNGGYETVASCSGHGHRPGSIALADGRELIIACNYEEARRIDRLFPTGANGEPVPAADTDAVIATIAAAPDMAMIRAETPWEWRDMARAALKDREG